MKLLLLKVFAMRIEKFLEQSAIFNLSVAYDEIIGDFQKKLAKEQVHLLQAFILTGLFFEDKPVRPTVLAASFSASKSNISHSLRSLERRLLIERKSSDEDARAYFFTLTKEGKKKVPRLIKIFDSVQNKLEAEVGGKRINPNFKLFREVYSRIKD
jgi:DNA-binding MarR family transcriptional regulator